jgi:hypothetical protein
MFKVTAIYANSWKSQKLAIRISYLNFYRISYFGNFYRISYFGKRCLVPI